MKQSDNKPSYFYAILATVLVLMVLGVALFSFWKVYDVSNQLKENIMMEIVLNDGVEKAKLDSLKIAIEGQPYCKAIEFVSKEKAAEILKKELNENFEELLGYNPLYDSYHLYLKNDNASATKMENIKTALLKNTEIKEVNFEKSVVTDLENLLKDTSWIVIAVVAFLLIFAVSLIFSTTKLYIFANRENIKTMQLFGATRWFIVKPFLGRSILNGLLAGIFASLLLGGIGYYLNFTFPNANLQNDILIYGIISASLILFGLIISFFSTLIASIKYLNYKL